MDFPIIKRRLDPFIGRHGESECADDADPVGGRGHRGVDRGRPRDLPAG